MSSRETPYFGEVSNRTLRVEDREAAARRALQKINQRRRQQNEEPVPWSSFIAEWNSTHSVDGMTDYDQQLGKAMLQYR